ncbi:SusC/RagA family TonB-linked outer membrane protein [Parapedobacter deserti]|uniref:SusC/RagA family TonB-linked outer membrane protein n=1 Tax=Parapedobacter deserti TaxID=1912957 RepID=A0ABV7JNE7_9SPHI
MKKNSYLTLTYCCRACFKKRNLIVIATLLVLLVNVWNAQASSEDLQKEADKITLSLKEGSLTQALKQIESVSGQKFVYNPDLTAPYSIEKQEILQKDLDSVLTNLIAGTNLTFTHVGENIVILPKSSGQNRTVSGKVLDIQEQPIVGATISVEGSNRGVITDEDGSFRLSIPQGETALDVRIVGYINKTEPISDSQTDLVIYLQEDVKELEEAVVVGYGTQKRVNLTGAVSVVSGKELADRVTPTVTGMLQGMVPGVNVTTNAGKPGSTPDINIRGITSINETEPLVLIDGAVGDLNRINPADVESISIIKDASAAAVYGARAAFGVILVTTKSGSSQDGKATVNYSSRMGWEEPTTSKDYEYRGYWSVFLVNKFWQADSGNKYIQYTDKDMEELWARVDDKTEHPDRPWVIEDVRDGRNRWIYYANQDWWNGLFSNNNPFQQHRVSLSGGSNDVKYLVSGSYLRQQGMQRHHPDVLNRYNMRSKVDFNINKWATLSSNLALYDSKYSNQNGIDGLIHNAANHALANFPFFNPDGTGIYDTDGLIGTYKVGNGRQIMLVDGLHPTIDSDNDISSTTRLVMNPIRTLTITGDFTYRFYQRRSTARGNPLSYRVYPDSPIEEYITGAGINRLTETVGTNRYKAFNAYANYEDTFNGAHHLTAVGGFNYETHHTKNVRAVGENLVVSDINDLNLVGTDANGAVITSVGGGQSEWALLGVFGRANYDYKGRYLAEFSGRYDGTSRFAPESRWGFFPSASVGWRISEEPFFKNGGAGNLIDNLKLRGSFGSLGNQNVSSYYAYIRLVSISNLNQLFGGNTPSKQAALGAPLADDLTWETAEQWDLGLDLNMLNNRLSMTTDLYIRNTKDMLTVGVALPAVYGANPPEMNAADLRTKGFEFSVNWRDQFNLAGKPFQYGLGFNLSDYKTVVTKYDNPERSFAKDHYVGQEWGEIWGYKTDGFFKTDEEARQYAEEVDLSLQSSRLTGGWMAGDLKFLDLNGDGVWGVGANTVDDPGDLAKLGNSLPSLSYGINASIRWMGFDATAFFQGVGTHHVYLHGNTRDFWGHYSASYGSFMPYNFIDKVWSEDNPDAYFPRARAYLATGGYLAKTNDHYLQNLAYLRLKNLTAGYTLPVNLSKRFGIDQLRLYFSGENLAYWSPLKKNTKYLDPETAYIYRNRQLSDQGKTDQAYYPWSKTFTFGIDITF